MNKSILKTFPWMENRQLPQNGDIPMFVFWQITDQVKTNAAFENTGDGWRYFKGWQTLDEYDSLIARDGKIVTIFSSKWQKRLSVWDFVQLKWDSRGYIGNGYWSGEWVTITGFLEPFERGHSDDIIQVMASDALQWFVKPKNIVFDAAKNNIKETLEGYDQAYVRWKDTKIDALFDELNDICYPYASWITDAGVLHLNPEMPNHLQDQVRVLSQRIVIAMGM